MESKQGDISRAPHSGTGKGLPRPSSKVGGFSPLLAAATKTLAARAAPGCRELVVLRTRIAQARTMKDFFGTKPSDIG
jgi:hypothetical protein